MIKYVFFDWNGTLLADTIIRYKLSMQGLKHMGHPGVTQAEYRKHHVIPHDQYLRNVGISEATIEKHGKAEREQFHAGYAKLVMRARTRKGARAILQALHEQGIHCIVLSNHTQHDIEKQSKRLRIHHYFDAILANADIHTAGKQGKFGLLEAYLQDNKLDPAQAVIVGDTAEETQIGKQVGMRTVALTGAIHTPGRLRLEQPDAVIDNLYALIDIIKEW